MPSSVCTTVSAVAISTTPSRMPAPTLTSPHQHRGHDRDEPRHEVEDDEAEARRDLPPPRLAHDARRALDAADGPLLLRDDHRHHEERQELPYAADHPEQQAGERDSPGRRPERGQDDGHRSRDDRPQHEMVRVLQRVAQAGTHVRGRPRAAAPAPPTPARR